MTGIRIFKEEANILQKHNESAHFLPLIKKDKTQKNPA